MTIVNVNYASLDEVFGSEFKKKKKKPKKTKTQKEASCNYYARRYDKNTDKDLNNIQSNDIVNNYAGYSVNDYAPELTGQKNMYTENNRNANQKHEIYIDEDEELDYFDKLYRSHEFKPLEKTDGNHLMDYEKNEDEDEDGLYRKPVMRREIKTDTLGRPNMMLLENRDLDKLRRYEEDQNYLDFGLYLISGILLIFILEQFVQLGMIMKEKRVNEKLYVF
tara:strand:- start:1051 stop:1713 length:663 start_codon:yes stop_codon:yes gene_type:complete